MNRYKSAPLAGMPLLIRSRREVAALLADMKYHKRTKYTSALVQSVLAIFQKNGRDVNLFMGALEAEGLCSVSTSRGKTYYKLSSKALIKFLDDTEHEKRVGGCVKNAEEKTTLQSTYIYKSDDLDFEQVQNLLHPTTYNNDEDTSCGKSR